MRLISRSSCQSNELPAVRLCTLKESLAQKTLWRSMLAPSSCSTQANAWTGTGTTVEFRLPHFEGFRRQ